MTAQAKKPKPLTVESPAAVSVAGKEEGKSYGSKGLVPLTTSLPS